MPQKSKCPQARLWSVWCESAGKKFSLPDADYWLESVHLTHEKAKERYEALRADYYLAELRDRTNRVVFSHDPSRVNLAALETLRDDAY